MTMKLWLCVDCWHEILSSDRVPQQIVWDDGHMCRFKSPEDIDQSGIVQYPEMIEDVKWGEVLKTELIPIHRDLQIAHSEEVKLMLRYALRAEKPQISLYKMVCHGSQWIANFEVKDLMKENVLTQINWHLQNTSQWLYAGCILYDERDNHVSRHH